MSDVRISSYASMLSNATHVGGPRRADATQAATANQQANIASPTAPAQDAQAVTRLLANNEGRGKLVDILV
jgi:hypothetical protein